MATIAPPPLQHCTSCLLPPAKPLSHAHTTTTSSCSSSSHPHHIPPPPHTPPPRPAHPPISTPQPLRPTSPSPLDDLPKVGLGARRAQHGASLHMNLISGCAGQAQRPLAAGLLAVGVVGGRAWGARVTAVRSPRSVLLHPSQVWWVCVYGGWVSLWWVCGRRGR